VKNHTIDHKFEVGQHIRNHARPDKILTIVATPNALHPEDYIVRGRRPTSEHTDPQAYPAGELEFRYDVCENGVEVFMETL
jgi:hypothetical protein